MELNEKELKKLPKGDALCFMAYVKSLEAIKEYEEKISKHKNPDHMSCSILKLVKETHENYGEILLNILTEMPSIQNAQFSKKFLIKNSPKRKKTVKNLV